LIDDIIFNIIDTNFLKKNYSLVAFPINKNSISENYFADSLKNEINDNFNELELKINYRNFSIDKWRNDILLSCKDFNTKELYKSILSNDNGVILDSKYLKSFKFNILNCKIKKKYIIGEVEFSEVVFDKSCNNAILMYQFSHSNFKVGYLSCLLIKWEIIKKRWEIEKNEKIEVW
jgi:hypothetical protein